MATHWGICRRPEDKAGGNDECGWVLDEGDEGAAHVGGKRRKGRWAESCVEDACPEYDERAAAVR